MGQEQSTTQSRRHTPTLTPSTSTSTNKLSLLNIALSHKDPTTDDRRALEEAEEQTDNDIVPEEVHGIIQVVKGPENEEQDEELKLLQSIAKFKPFIKEQDKGVSIESLLGFKLNTATKSRETSTTSDNQVISDCLVDMLASLQCHINEKVAHVNLEQRILLKRIAYVDELSSSSCQTMVAALYQAKSAADKISEVSLIKEQAMKAQNHLVEIFKTLNAIEDRLDPEDRISISNDSNTKWPELNKLRVQAAKSAEMPLLERYISTASDMTTVGTSTTSPLLEKVVVNATDQSLEGGSNDPSGSGSVSASSLALSRLRGLSSRSIAKDAHTTDSSVNK